MTLSISDIESFKTLPAPPDLTDDNFYRFKLQRYRNKCFLDAVKKDLHIEEHPKADAMMDIAWNLGRAGGYREVYREAVELVELLR